MIPKSPFITLACLLATALPALAQSTGYKQNALCVSGQDALCSELPTDLEGLTVPFGYTPTTDISVNPNGAQQSNFDFFGWQMFVALNWPSDEKGAPVGSITDAEYNKNPRVWESYPTIGDVFGGASSACNSQGRLTLSRTSKIHSGDFISPMTSSPLIDRDGNYVMFDIRLNETEAAYLRKNDLTTANGQKTFKKSHPEGWNLPRGTRVTSGDTVTAHPGAMELKTAWRILNPDEDHSNFHTVLGVVEVPANNSATGKPMCLDVVLGLVGMHMMQKITTPSQFSEFWVWATFEHNRNAPLAQGAPVSQKDKASSAQGLNPYDPVASCPVPTDTSGEYSFFNANCVDNAGKACAPNTELPHMGKIIWEEKPPYAKRYLNAGKYGSQVTRCWKVYESAHKVSSDYRKALAGSVWEHYDLVGVQWAVGSLDNPANKLTPFPAPIYLVNTTLETYLQNKPVVVNGAPAKGAAGSCITCHNNGYDRGGNKSDFSFLGFYAQD